MSSYEASYVFVMWSPTASILNLREKKIEGLTFLRSMAHYHSDTLQGRLHDVCLSLIQEVYNWSHLTLPDHFHLFIFCCFILNQTPADPVSHNVLMMSVLLR